MADQHADHEKPSDWGWHGEAGRLARFGGWFCAIILILMLTTTHYNWAGSVWMIGVAAALIVVLLWDRQRRKYSWRK